MKSGFYSRLALNNLKKNYRFFIPRILCETGLLGCFYIAVTLVNDNRLASVSGGDYIPTFMVIAVAVLGLLSAVIIFYVNSFLMKQRKKEFGMYNVLGMEKKHIGRVLFHESFVSSVISVVFGLLFGILFYKLCSLLICRLLKAEIIIGMYFINAKTIIESAAFFFVLDALSYLFNLISISRMKPVELLASKQTGEKEPKIKWALLILGILSIGGGYYISLTTKTPLAALELFFIAVILVIIGTYFIFVAGSIFVLKALKKNPKIYYDKKRMPAISGLIYRMKQNAVGLASIAILATGVLVMVSTTVSLYSGIDGTLNKNYAYDFYSVGYFIDENDVSGELIPEDTALRFAETAAKKSGLEIESHAIQNYLEVAYMKDDNEFKLYDAGLMPDNICDCVFITADVYNELAGENVSLEKDEIITCRISSDIGNAYDLTGTVHFQNSEFKVKNTIYAFPVSIPVIASGFIQYGLVVADGEVLDAIYNEQKEQLGDFASNYSSRLAVNFTDKDKMLENGWKFTTEFYTATDNYVRSSACEKNGYSYYTDSYWEARDSMFGMFGTLLFLGILLGSVCMFATVLIIYYKQISEGYEDKERFKIMEKIGMSRAEVKKTIDSQVLLVFFLPLITAGVHVAFAYPLLRKMLKILMLYDAKLFLVCTVISYLVFSVVYVIIYKGTSRTYYRIVR